MTPPGSVNLDRTGRCGFDTGAGRGLKCPGFRRLERMRIAFYLPLGLLLASLAPAQTPAPGEAEVRIRVHGVERDDLPALVGAGLAILDRRAGQVEALVIDPAALERLAKLGVAFELLEPEPGPGAATRTAYHDYAATEAALQALADAYPGFIRRVVLGTSVQGRNITALKITDQPDLEEDEPEVRLLGCHHGNEWISVEVPLGYAEWLASGYGVDPVATELIDQTEIWIAPLVNPDGRQTGMFGTRHNAHNVDLNRNYSYLWNNALEPFAGPLPFSEPETRAVRDNALTNSFVLSHSFHSGAEYVNYLWNCCSQPTPDEPMLINLSNLYSGFSGLPIINGWDWFQTNGDTNDWSYGERGDLDWTIELSSAFRPLSSEIPAIVAANIPAISATFQAALRGVRGLVHSSESCAPLAATVRCLEVDWPVFTDPALGDYHRTLEPGTYTLEFSAPGYQTLVVSDVVVGSGAATRLDISLSPLPIAALGGGVDSASLLRRAQSGP